MTNKERESILGAITNLAQDVGKVQSKQTLMHADVLEIKDHQIESNGRLSEVEHQLMTWKTRFITAFSIIALSAPFIIEQSRTFILSIVT